MFRKILLALGGGLAGGTACQSNEMPPTPGRSIQIESYLRQLTTADGDAFLIMEVAPPDAFLQVKWTAEGFELDHPLITMGQRGREGRFRELCTSRGYSLREVLADQGGRFLDCYLPADVPRAAAAIREMLTDLFDVDDTTSLTFSGEGLQRVAL
jgi:hypothetical protein